MSSVRYRIYPSLLDRFQAFLDSDEESEGFWNLDGETGEMKRTAEEIAEAHERELLDAINRVPHEPIEAADRGTCFNEIIDCLVENRGSSREDIVIKTVPVVHREGAIDNFGKPLYYDEYPTGKKCILAALNDFEFMFDIGLCRESSAYFRGAVPQHFCRAVMPTAYGDVELYGYADEIVRDKVYDIKTTSSYQFGRFERAWQKDVYPWCLVESGEMKRVSSFEYTVFVLSRPTSKSPVITGKMYREEYTYDHSAAGERLRAFLERFIEWLESRRDMITDKKIFGGENTEE